MQVNGPGLPVQITPASANNASGAALAIVLAYVVPAGRVARIHCASWVLTAGVAPVMALETIVGGVTITNHAAPAQGITLFPVWLNGGDTCQWRVATVGAGATVDLLIALEEFLAQ